MDQEIIIKCVESFIKGALITLLAIGVVTATVIILALPGALFIYYLRELGVVLSCLFYVSIVGGVFYALNDIDI